MGSDGLQDRFGILSTPSSPEVSLRLMKFDENEVVLPIEPKKGQWKRVMLVMLGLVVTWILLTIWAMHRPWGQIHPGVRMEPLRVYTEKDVTPGCFWDLQSQALDAYGTKEEPEEVTAALYEIQARGWKFWQATDYPELATYRAENQSSLDLIFLSWKKQEGFSLLNDHPSNVRPLTTLLRLALAQSLLSPAGEIPPMLQERLAGAFLAGQSMANGTDLWHGGWTDGFRPWVLHCMRSAALQGVSAEVLDAWSRLLANSRPSEDAFSERIRLFSQAFEIALSNNRNPKELPLRYVDSSLFNFQNLIGSENAHRIHHMKVVLSELLHEIDRNPSNPDFQIPIKRYLTVNPKWMVYLKADPISRLQIPATPVVLLYGYYLQFTGHLHATQAVLALHSHHLRNGTWPAVLSDAMPEVPLDPFDGKPLRYRLEKNGTWVVYSIGPDRMDDGGVPAQVSERDIVFASNQLERLEQAWQKEKAEQDAEAATSPTKSSQSYGVRTTR